LQLLKPLILQGGYGEVKKALHKKSNIVRAVKIVDKHPHDPERVQRVMGEVNILKSLV